MSSNSKKNNCIAEGLCEKKKLEEQKEIITIYHEAQPILRADGSVNDGKHLRVAAYARVSTLKEEQSESYETQVSYFQNFIKNNPDWEYVGIYTDKGKSGRGVKNRPGLTKMIEDAKGGKIDMILIKSISRFFRNCYKAQETLQILEEYKVEVRFLEGNISSTDPGARMAIQLLTSVAENESRSISENIKWTYRRLAEQGIRRLGNNHVWGYDEIDGTLVPNEDADAIRFAFESFADGMSYIDICLKLEEMGVTTMKSHNKVNSTTLKRAFENEIYVGDRLLQKQPPTDPNPNASKKSTKAYESKYVKNAHTPIVSRNVWDAVQSKLERRKELYQLGIITWDDPHVLMGKVYCGKCGSFLWIEHNRYRKEIRNVWYCKECLKRERGNIQRGIRTRIFEKDLIEKIAVQLNIEFEDGYVLEQKDVDRIEKIEVTIKSVKVFEK